MLLIHVVAPGDTLFTIARRYGVTVDALIETNRPPNPENLVVGQDLVIPTEDLLYTVRRGETLFNIGLLFGLTPAALAAANGLANPNLIFPGQTLRIPGWESLTYTVRPGDSVFLISRFFGADPALLVRINNLLQPERIAVGQRIVVPLRGVEPRRIQTNGFIFPTSLANARRVLAPIAPLLTYISVFDFPVDGQGGVTSPNYGPLVQAARELNIAPLAVLTNFQGGNFDSDLAHAVLVDPAVRARTIQNYLALLRAGGFAGAMVDFENMYPADRQLYSQFIAELAAALRPLGLVVSIAAAPKWADFPNAPWVGTFDYAALGRIVDFIYLMTYEWGWIGGPPGPVAPINLVRRVLDYATALIPAGRVMQGIPLYGYDWPLPDTPETIAATVDPQQAIALAASRGGGPIRFDETAQTPTFNYRDETGRAHEVWFEDARSTRAKYQAVRDYNLLGAGFWQLFNDFPQNWVVLDELFEVVKRV